MNEVASGTFQCWEVSFVRFHTSSFLIQTKCAF
jgi:hypothetical protein